MEIPYQALSAETLQNLLEEIASRDGTDYGERELDLAAKVAQLRKQLTSGEAVLYFNAESESCAVLSRDAARALAKSAPDT